MRCAFPSFLTQEEKDNRLEYFEEIFGVKFLKKSIVQNFEIYSSNPPNRKNYFFIVGHNEEVKKFLSSIDIKEKNIVITSCCFSIPKKIIKKKNIFLCNPVKEWGRISFYDGCPYGFKFFITDAELNLYNSKYNLKNSDIEKIKFAYYKY
ncbi:MAG: hypothetical protein ACRCZR_03515 [Cetobacterium sp.]